MAMADSPRYGSLVRETAADCNDIVFTRGELSDIPHPQLRTMAAEAKSDCIGGKSTKFEIIAYFECQTRLDEF